MLNHETPWDVDARLRRLRALQRAREERAREYAASIPLAQRFRLDRTTTAAARLDQAYESGAPLRNQDREIRRYRRLLREAS